MAGRIAAQDAHTNHDATDAKSFFPLLPDAVRDVVADFVDRAPALGGEIDWRRYGPRVRVRGSEGPKVIITFDRNGLWLTVGPRKGLDSDALAATGGRIENLTGVSVGTGFASLQWRSADTSNLQTLLAETERLIQGLTATT